MHLFVLLLSNLKTSIFNIPIIHFFALFFKIRKFFHGFKDLGLVITVFKTSLKADHLVTSRLFLVTTKKSSVGTGRCARYSRVLAIAVLVTSVFHCMCVCLCVCVCVSL